MDAYLQELLRRLLSEQAAERFEAQQGMSQIDVYSKRELIAPLIQALENPAMRAPASTALGAIGRLAIPDLIQFTRNEKKEKLARYLAQMTIERILAGSSPDGK